MGRKHQHYGGIVGAGPLVSNVPRTSGVFSLGALGGDGATTTRPTRRWGGITGRSITTSVAGDANWNDVTLLLDGSSTTNDVANSQVFETVTNVAKQSTGGPNNDGPVLDFGSGGNTPTTGHLLDTNPTSLPQGTEDFTVEFWFRRDYVNDSQARTLFAGINGTSQIQLDIYLTATKTVNYYHSGANQITGAKILGYQTWHHIAAVRSAGTTTLYVDGASQGSFSDTGSYATSSHLGIGAYYDGTSWVTGVNSLQGQMTDVRVTRGVARYSGPFTRPAAAFPTSAGGAASLENTGVLSLAEHYQSKL